MESNDFDSMLTITDYYIAFSLIFIVIIIGSVFLFKNMEFYVDEIYERRNVLDENDTYSVGEIIIYKRTYKNGTVKYIRKIYKNN